MTMLRKHTDLEHGLGWFAFVAGCRACRGLSGIGSLLLENGALFPWRIWKHQAGRYSFFRVSILWVGSCRDCGCDWQRFFCCMANQLDARRRQRQYQGRRAMEVDAVMRKRNRIQERTRGDAERDCQRRIRVETLNAHRNPCEFPETAEEVVNKNEVLQIASKLEGFLDNGMVGCRGVLTRNAVMEEFLGSELVSPHLPSYYLSPTDAYVQQHVLQGFQDRLEAVKGVQS